MMRDIYNKAFGLARTKTAQDTYILFGGNILNAALGLIFTVLVARSLTDVDFGVFSAVSNLVMIVIALTDLGTTSGLVKFVAELESKNKFAEAEKYIKAAFNFKLAVFLLLSLILIVFSQPIAENLLATSDHRASHWVIAISIGMFFSSFIPFVLYAKKRFLRSAAIDVSYGLGRVVFVLPLMLGGLTLYESYAAYAAAGIISLVVIAFVYGFSFLKRSVDRGTYKDLILFSGWLGVNKMISSLASKVDVQLLALLASASAIGYYTIANRLAFFISFLAASFSSVLAPRLAAFNDPKQEIQFIKKATLALIPVSFGIIVWIIFARPFVIIFGEQHLPAVNVFRVLALSMIPFVFTVPSVTAIIYAIKKPKYIGRFSILQLILVVSLNVLLIPRMGVFAPALVFGIINTLLAVYSWAIVISHYKNKL